MVNAIKLSENEANEIIAKYLRTISNIVDAKLNSNMYGYTGDPHNFVQGNIHIYIFQVMNPCTSYLDMLWFIVSYSMTAFLIF